MPLKYNNFSSDNNRRPSKSSGYNAKGTDSRYKKSGSSYGAGNSRANYEGLRDRKTDSHVSDPSGAAASENNDRPFRKYAAGADRRPTGTGAGRSFGGDSGERKPFDRKFGSGSGRDDSRRDGSGERKPFDRKFDTGGGRDDSRRDGPGERKPFERKFDTGRGPRREEGRRDGPGERKPFERKFGAGGERDDRRSEDSGERKPFERKFGTGGDRDDRRSDYSGERKPFERKFGAGGDRGDSRSDGSGERKPFERKFDSAPRRDAGRRDGSGEKKPFARRPGPGLKRDSSGERKPFEHKFGSGPGRDDSRRDTPPSERKPFEKKYSPKPAGDEHDMDGAGERKPFGRKRISKTDRVGGELVDAAGTTEGTKMPLNKYVAHSGICSRREAAQLVKDGKVTVNNTVVTDPGYKVLDNDIISYEGAKLNIQKEQVYVLLNKPKDYITTTEDEKGRKTVMELVADCSEDRLFPVGRLDRNTTGLLLLTNDGTLAQRLTHPSFKIKKVYHVSLDKPLTEADFNKIVEGVTLEDGTAHVDALAYLETRDELGIEIHSGKNRVIRRIFEALGYEVVKLDRMMYAGLTKKNVPRGKWRFLTPHEVVLLKHFKS